MEKVENRRISFLWFTLTEERCPGTQGLPRGWPTCLQSSSLSPGDKDDDVLDDDDDDDLFHDNYEKEDGDDYDVAKEG